MSGVSQTSAMRNRDAVKAEARAELEAASSSVGLSVAAPAAAGAADTTPQPMTAVDQMLADATQAEFEQWKKAFGKRYYTKESQAAAFENFRENSRISKTMNAILKQPATKLSSRSDQPPPKV